MMKRSLTVAIAALTLVSGNAFAAEDFKVGLNGFLNAGFLGSAVSNADNAMNGAKSYEHTDIVIDNIINITGNTVLDNGLKATAVAGFSMSMGASNNGAANNTQTNIYQEELYAGLGGSFGDVNLGRRRNAASLLHTFIPSAGVGTFAVDDARSNAFVSGVTGASTATSLGDGNNQQEYANRIMYFTPRIEGVQLAASFTPTVNPNKEMATFRNLASTRAELTDEVSAGLNYAREVAGVGVTASGGYTVANGVAGGSLVAGSTVPALRDQEAIQGGANLSYAGFTLGGAWGQLENATFKSGNTQNYGGGLKYATGPWTFGTSMMRREANGGQTITLTNMQQVGKSDLYEVGAKYALGPGVATGVGVYYNDNQELQNRASTVTAEDSVAGVVNLSVNF